MLLRILYKLIVYVLNTINIDTIIKK